MSIETVLSYELKQELKYIFNKFGVKTQYEKLQEEIKEEQEAVSNYIKNSTEENRKAMISEIVDVAVVLSQFYLSDMIYIVCDLFTPVMIERIVVQTYLLYPDEFEYKVKRTLERIESGYYEKE